MALEELNQDAAKFASNPKYVAQVSLLSLPQTFSTIKKRFLVAYSMFGTVSVAARHTGISVSSHYKWNSDSQYREAFELATKIHTDEMEYTAFKLATGQYMKPVVSMGKIVTYERIFDTKVLLKVLGAKLPERYTNRVDVTTNGHSLVKLVDQAAWDSI
jgi:hypothetical protein